MINKIKSNLKSVDHILHIADVHLRNWKRHTEFKKVFDSLFEVADNLPPNSIITVGGDIVHAKTDMSPELIDMVSYLFNGLADRHPTIVITGNHDANLNNQHRLDALTPIVNSNRHPNLFYLRNTDLYEIGDIAISVFSLLDSSEDYITYDKIDNPKKYKKLVALYHGTISNSKVDSGLTLEHGLEWDKFAGFDVVPLGDIHKRQVLSKQNPAIFYPGSLVQQNFGEAYEGHGYALIDLTKADRVDYSFTDIPNDYGYYTLDISDGILPDNLPITAKTRLRIRTRNTDSAQLKRLLATIRKDYKNKDAIIVKLDKGNGSVFGDFDENTINQGDVRNVQYQNQLLKEYLEDIGTDPLTVTKSLEINTKLNQELHLPEISRNVIWKPKKFEFSNMFSYGEDNVIDFGTKKGTCGLFAPNHAGKSATLDALCFCLFDQSFRATKADQVLNRKSEWFDCTLNFELNGVDYFIYKKAYKYRSGALKGRLRVEIDFWKIGESGEKVSLNGEMRRDTDKIIQSYIGTFDNFILTALSLQQNNSNFIDKTQSERKDLLANFLDVTIFDSLYDLAKNNNRKASIALEEYQKQNFETKLGDAEKAKESYEVSYKEATKESDQANNKLESLNEKIIELNKKIQPCAASGLNLQELQTQLSLTQKQYNDLYDRKKQSTIRWEKSKEDLEKLQVQKQEIDSKFDRQLFEEYLSKQLALKEANIIHNNAKVSIQNKIDKVQKLENHEYDPNCKHCVSNVFVQDAMKASAELQEDKKRIADFLSQRQSLVDFVEKHQNIEKISELLNTTVSLWNEARITKSEAESDYEKVKSLMDQKQLDIDKIQANIDLYNKSLSTIESNKQIQDQLSIANKEKNIQSIACSKANNVVKDYYGKLEVCNQVIKECNETIQRMRDLLEEQDAYDVYCKAMYKDGIPYQLISKAVPYIQHQANDILNQIADFQIELDTDGKNINAFIQYEDEKWALELSSGMERFMSSIAIRIALIKITNLPKPDFIALDEGMGVLDSTNLNSMHNLFTSIKDTFRFSLVISHIDVVRDMVDNILTIDRKGDFSQIKC
jgi:DNA repair exonuclease SbcCD ATPase subunit/DNA repair exonuclease SbcCD nuclease subunit